MSIEEKFAIKKTQEVYVIMAPPLSQYPEQLSDQSKCELVNCPKCKNKIWLSIKKKELMKKFNPEQILLRCYDCLTKMALENPQDFARSTRIDI